MFVSWKKLCKIAQEEAEAWRKIAAGKTEQVENLLEQIKDLYNKRADMYNYCLELKHDKDELLTRVKELEAEKEGLELRIDILNTDYNALCEERDRYKERVEAFEEGKYLVREAER